MSYVDLSAALGEWPYDPERISVRKILGEDGGIRIQMRVELGILQMEAEGRPDGSRPFERESLLAYHSNRLSKHLDRNGTTLGFGLTRQECHALREEASLYYRRYIAMFVLEELDAVVADTSHSLAIFDFCREYALEREDRDWLEEYRPYVLMMRARAQAYQALQEEEPASALAHVNRGLLEIRAHFEQSGQLEAVENCEEMKMLRSLGSELGEKVPKNSLVVTRKALRSAVEQERFEEAARLRDELKNLYPNVS